jgi:hypothetical protein
VVVDPQCPRWNEEEENSFNILVEHVENYRAIGMQSAIEPAVKATGALLVYCFPELD